MLSVNMDDTLRLPPSEILYSKRCIENCFSGGTPLPKVFAQLISGDLSVIDLPRIEVDSKDDFVWWTVHGNRRLFLYKKLETAGVVGRINVNRCMFPPLTFRRDSMDGWDGKTVFCAQIDLESTLDDIVRDWRAGRNVMEKWDDFDQGSTTKFGHSEKSKSDEVDYFGEEHYGEDRQFEYCENDRDWFKSEMTHDDRSRRRRKVRSSSLRKEPKYIRKDPLYGADALYYEAEDNYDDYM